MSIAQTLAEELTKTKGEKERSERREREKKAQEERARKDSASAEGAVSAAELTAAESDAAKRIWQSIQTGDIYEAYGHPRDLSVKEHGKAKIEDEVAKLGRIRVGGPQNDGGLLGLFWEIYDELYKKLCKNKKGFRFVSHPEIVRKFK